MRERVFLLSFIMLMVFLLSVAGMASAQPKSFETFPLNVNLFHAVNDHRVPAVDLVIASLAPYYYVIPALVVILLAWKTDRRVLVVALVAIAIETVLVQGLKSGFRQPRPALILPPGSFHLLIPLGTRSFPSGDAAVCFALAASLMGRAERWVQGVMYLYATAIAYERVYIGVHFPLDVVTGAAIGLLSGYVAYLWLGRRTFGSLPSAAQSEETSDLETPTC